MASPQPSATVSKSATGAAPGVAGTTGKAAEQVLHSDSSVRSRQSPVNQPGTAATPGSDVAPASASVEGAITPATATPGTVQVICPVGQQLYRRSVHVRMPPS